MPGGNRTGPLGEGPKTGRGLGFCSGQEQPDFKNSNEKIAFGYSRGWGNRWRKGRYHHFRHGFDRFSFETPTNVSEETKLKNEARILKEQLNSIEKQLLDLKKKTD